MLFLGLEVEEVAAATYDDWLQTLIINFNKFYISSKSKRCRIASNHETSKLVIELYLISLIKISKLIVGNIDIHLIPEHYLS